MIFLNPSKPFGNYNAVPGILNKNRIFILTTSRNITDVNGLFKTDNFKRIRSNRFKIVAFLQFTLTKLPHYFKEQTIKVVKTCSEQCEFVLAHRIRRGQQIFSFYVKWWGEIRLFTFIHQIKQSMLKKRYFAYTLCSVPLFSWDNQRIPDNELSRLQDELDRVKRLMNVTNENVTNTHYEDEISYDVTNTAYCRCNRCVNDTEEEWVLFYSNDFIHIWRREHTDHKGEGIYVYKVYGQFNDVTAEDFFQVQIDTDYRKEWDANSVQICVIDSEPQSNSDILYWEFQFTKMFCNRDYVCNRRYKIDEDKNVMIILSESVNHPSFPENPSLHRVKEYWSHMVIKPNDDFNKPGIEFSVTYFDNPGISLPNYITSWYTITGMPEYLTKQKNAAKLLAERRDVECQKDTNVNDKEFLQNNKNKLIGDDKVPTSNRGETFPTHHREKQFLFG